MTLIAFDKMEGAGNDFVFVDHRRPLLPEPARAHWARILCDRKFGVGADGLVLVGEETGPDSPPMLNWDFFNADGTRPAMCGNAARCMALFARHHGLAAADAFAFRAPAGIIEVAILPGGDVRVGMPDVAPPRLLRGLEAPGGPYDAWWVDTGVPHAVVLAGELDRLDVAGAGRALRRHPAMGEAGANVNFAAREADGLRVRTYERGVEGETLACGTGATASAIACGRAMGLRPPVRVGTAGGFFLQIGWTFTAEGGARGVSMAGPARRVFGGRMEITV